MEELLREAAERAVRHLRGRPERPVAPAAGALADLAELDTALPDKPTPPGEVLARLDDLVSPTATALAGPRFFGSVVGGTPPVALAAGWLAASWEQPGGPGPTAVEEAALRWLVDLFDLPAGTAGGFVASGATANLTALVAARRAVLARAGWDVDVAGLSGAPPVTVVVGEEAHPTVLKALALLGFGRDRVARVRVDGQGRLRPALIPPATGPMIVCAQAGNPDTGAVDPLAAVCARAGEEGAWVHVDGAFGIWATASPDLRARLAGVRGADSWATDAGTWLGVPYDSGLVFSRDGAALRAVRAGAEATPDRPRRARGAPVWAALAALGRDGVAELVERACGQARRFARELSGGGYAVLNDVVLNQVLVSFGDAARTTRVIDRVRADGVCWCGGTVWQGRTAMRISVGNWSTTDDDVTRSIAAIHSAARSVT